MGWEVSLKFHTWILRKRNILFCQKNQRKGILCYRANFHISDALLYIARFLIAYGKKFSLIDHRKDWVCSSNFLWKFIDVSLQYMNVFGDSNVIVTLYLFRKPESPKLRPRPLYEGKDGTPTRKKNCNCKHSKCLKL